MKVETHGKWEFIGICPKMHSILYHENDSEIQEKVNILDNIRHGNYKDLFVQQNKNNECNEYTLLH